MENVNLSLPQKTLQAFGSKKVPTFAFQIRVEMPTILQLEGPSHIPVRLHAIPDWKKTTEIIRNIPQKLRLTSLNMHITAMTEVIGQGYTSVRSYHITHNTSLTVDEAMEAPGGEIFIPCGDGEAPLDIGELINLRIGYDGRIGIGQPYLNKNCLSPSFTTFNIKHIHRLRWKLRYSVGDQKGVMEGGEVVDILTPVAPEGDWIQPPPEDDLPPPFSA
ncbi:uncharacterized protein DNG_07066 [Cephalotrichum gorgonifer]|uniref:Uncharacterized protein n=1 Tax=Cephalotrichum gorgonifer TaxID=2041049 RepID=A0AAE8SX17_9PEZI|nr:uncharacterized protein DNG_07066 [Cephalotrichum gorgonifer]